MYINPTLKQIADLKTQAFKKPYSTVIATKIRDIDEYQCEPYQVISLFVDNELSYAFYENLPKKQLAFFADYLKKASKLMQDLITSYFSCEVFNRIENVTIKNIKDQLKFCSFKISKIEDLKKLNNDQIIELSSAFFEEWGNVMSFIKDNHYDVLLYSFLLSDNMSVEEIELYLDNDLSLKVQDYYPDLYLGYDDVIHYMRDAINNLLDK